MTTNDTAADRADVPAQTNEQDHEAQEPSSVAPGISIPLDSNIVGGGKPGEGTDVTTAGGPSDSGGG